jgi:hypothetical protein
LFIHQAFSLGTIISWALLMICLPIMMTANCCANSIKHPPALHCNQQIALATFYTLKSFRHPPGRRESPFIWIESIINWITHVFVSKAQDVRVTARVADEAALEEGDVEYGRVEVDELENEHLECEVVVKLSLCAVHFWNHFMHIN